MDEEPSQTVVYGVMTNGNPKFVARLEAQLETWAAGLSQSPRFFAVAGRNAGANATFLTSKSLVIDDRCDDAYGGIACKEERIMEEGLARNATWLYVLGEDNYVDVLRLEKELSIHRLDTPQVLGIVGCGKGLHYCVQVDDQGGLCGGGGYALNRAALQQLLRDGKKNLRTEYAVYKGTAGDMATSCAVRGHGIRMASLYGLRGNPTPQVKEFERIVDAGSLVYHYIDPRVMHWLHARLRSSADPRLASLRAAAFDDDGCCRDCCKDYFRDQCKAALSSSAHLLKSGTAEAAGGLAAGADGYIALRDAQLRRLLDGGDE